VEYLRAMSPDAGGIPVRAHSIETVAWSSADASIVDHRSDQTVRLPKIGR
jgi:hypothetical protein